MVGRAAPAIPSTWGAGRGNRKESIRLPVLPSTCYWCVFFFFKGVEVYLCDSKVDKLSLKENPLFSMLEQEQLLFP